MLNEAIGQYQITSPLGAGAMGEVYRARDTRLGRDVAIKVLPRGFAAEPERLGRFEQEARTLASLNHPGIMGIYDSGIHQGAPYLVSELLEGQTLRDLLKNGPLPLRKAVEFTVQIAHALDAAHNKGIIHRDLKPENLFITNDDRVKVLDFGLAKLRADAADRELPSSERPTLMHKTEPGMVLGTPGYMSPEQARGGEAEERSDIFSLGAILYEMLCGQRAFQGESSVQAMNAILTAEPTDLFEHVPNLPPALERVVRRCLEKRPEQRFQSAADLAFALGNSISLGSSMHGREAIAAPRRLSAGRLLPWAITTVAVAAAAYAIRFTHPASPVATVLPRPAPLLRKIELSVPSGSSYLTIAPDGKKAVYVNQGLWLVRLDRLASPVLLAAERQQFLGIQHPIWSPDSADVAYFDDEKFYRVAVAGGSPQPIIANDPPIDIAGGAWLADDRIFYTSDATGGLYEVPATGGTSKIAVVHGADERTYFNASALPGARGVVFGVHRTTGDPPNDSIAVWGPSSPRKVLIQIPGSFLGEPAYAPSGHIVFDRNDRGASSIWAFPFSLEKLERTGEAFRVADDAIGPSFSDDGTLVYRLVTSWSDRQLVWVDRSGKITGTVGPPVTGISGPALSADGRRIAAVAGNSATEWDIWTIDVNSGTAVPLMKTQGSETDPFWYPDSRKVLYAATASAVVRRVEGWDVRAKVIDGFITDEKVMPGWVRFFSRSGRYLFVRALGREIPGGPPELAGAAVWAYVDLSPASDHRARLLPEGINALDVALSPDDRVLAYVSNETGRNEVFVVSFPDFTNNKTRVSSGGGERVQWHPDGSELFWLTPSGNLELWSARVKHDADLEIGPPAKVCELPESIKRELWYPTRTRFQVAPDGQRFLMVQSIGSPKDRATDQNRQNSNAILVENWFEEFREKR